MDLLRVRASAFACACLSLFLAAGCAATAATDENAGGPLAARVTDDGLICRNIRPVGSRISERVCMTAEQWQRSAEADRDAMQETQRNATVGVDAE